MLAVSGADLFSLQTDEPVAAAVAAAAAPALGNEVEEGPEGPRVLAVSETTLNTLTVEPIAAAAASTASALASALGDGSEDEPEGLGAPAGSEAALPRANAASCAAAVAVPTLGNEVEDGPEGSVELAASEAALTTAPAVQLAGAVAVIDSGVEDPEPVTAPVPGEDDDEAETLEILVFREAARLALAVHPTLRVNEPFGYAETAQPWWEARGVSGLVLHETIEPYTTARFTAAIYPVGDYHFPASALAVPVEEELVGQEVLALREAALLALQTVVIPVGGLASQGEDRLGQPPVSQQDVAVAREPAALTHLRGGVAAETSEGGRSIQVGGEEPAAALLERSLALFNFRRMAPFHCAGKVACRFVQVCTCCER